MKYGLKWTNKFSGETGYVKKVMKVKGFFVNTYDAAEAKSYKNEKAATEDIAVLESIGEAENNTFEAVELA